MKQKDIEERARALDHLTMDALWAEVRALRAERDRLREALTRLAAHDHAADMREGLEPCAELQRADDVLAEGGQS